MLQQRPITLTANGNRWYRCRQTSRFFNESISLSGRFICHLFCRSRNKVVLPILFSLLTLSSLSAKASFISDYYPACTLPDTVKFESQSDLDLLDYLAKSGFEESGLTTIIQASDFNHGLISSPWELIMGKIPGVIISSNDGSPGGSYSITNLYNLNFSNDSKPLVVLNGVPLINTPLLINPADIEKIIYSRDSYLTGKYGSMADNGVLFIYTKKGSGDLQVNYIGKLELAGVHKKYDMLSSREFAFLIAEKYPDNPDAIDHLGTASTDWQNEIFRTAPSFDNYLSVRGNVLSVPVSLTAGKTCQEGVIKTSSFNRSSVLLTVNPSFFKNHLKINISTSGTYNSTAVVDQNLVYNALIYDPTRPVYSGKSKYGGFFENDSNYYSQNPVAMLNQFHNSISENRWTSRIEASYRLHFLPDFKISGSYSTDDYSRNAVSVIDTSNIKRYGHGYKSTTVTGQNNRILDVHFDYATHILALESGIELSGGYFSVATHQDYDFEKSYIYPSGVYDLYRGYSNDANTSYYGRIGYSFKEKYFLKFSMTNEKNPYSYYYSEKCLNPSFSANWDISKEPFMSFLSFLPVLNIRFNYDSKRVFRSQPSLFTGSGDETIKAYSAGLDFALPGNIIQGNINLTERSCTNMGGLVAFYFGGESAYTMAKIGDIKTRGADISLFGDFHLKDKISIRFGLNATLAGNKVTLIEGFSRYAFNFNVTSTPYSSGIRATETGQRVNTFFLYHQVYDQKGNPVSGAFTDTDNSGTINDLDRYYFKQSVPTFLAGLYSTLSYKNWEFSFSGRLNLGNWVSDQEKAYFSIAAVPYYDGVYDNFPGSLVDTKYFTSINMADFWSDYFVENASFFRMDYISAGYTFKGLFKSKTDLAVRTIVENAFILTGYGGNDPEVSSGISSFMYPRSTTATIELKLSF